MGAHCCKPKCTNSDEAYSYCPPRTHPPCYEHTITNNTSSNAMVPSISANIGAEYNVMVRTVSMNSLLVDKLILETLSVICYLVDNEQEPPPSMLKLHNIADNEEGWIQVITSIVRVIPMDNPLGPSVITLLMEDCPLPSRNSIIKISELFGLSAESATANRDTPTQQRNICVVLGCIAEKLAGPNSITILSDGTLDYLIENLNPDVDPNVILCSLVALEKFAQTRENKLTIKRRLEKFQTHPLFKLEEWRYQDDYLKRQVGFCAQWCLDNLFVAEGRNYSYERQDMSCINTMLNTSDASEYLKISPDGLEARCDAYFFESVRCTSQINDGVWYYEALVITPGVMQIGWATKNSNFLNHEGYGIGDDAYSIAYDGCRCLIWYGARSEPQNVKCWEPGDILGCLIDLNLLNVIFYINGVALPACSHIFNKASTGFFAAASFMSFQQCRFNFGAEPYRFPPEKSFSSLNEVCTLTDEEKKVIPRHVLLKQMRRKFSINEDSCTLCFDQRASIRLLPCDHKGFCSSCARQLTECPMCRSPINIVTPDSL